MKFTKNIDYTVNVKYDLNYEPLSNFTKIEHFKNGENLYVSSLKITKTKKGDYDNVNKITWSNIITKEHLDALISSPEIYLDLAKKFSTNFFICLVKPIYLTEFSKYGLDEQLAKILNEKKLKLN